MPRVIFTFENKEDMMKWVGAYSNSGEQEIFEYWYQDNEPVPAWQMNIEEEGEE